MSTDAGLTPRIHGAEETLRDLVETTDRHRTAYIEAGPVDGPLLIFIHGHPELGIVWRDQIEHFASAGWRCIAPDMRGYGGSSVHEDVEAYSMREIVEDMAELHDSLGGAPAVWVGHDFGGPVVWQLAATEATRCRAVASMNLPYFPTGFGLESLVPLVDRELYPVERYPLGQFDYIKFYEESPEKAAADRKADVPAFLAMLFSKTPPEAVGTPAFTATVRENGGWFGTADRAPKTPRDPRVMSEEMFDAFVAAFERNGFAGPDSWYRNEAANIGYAEEAPNGGQLTLPVLYMHSRFDVVIDTVNAPLAEPMRAACTDLTEVTFDAGHWLGLESPREVNAAIEQWLAANRLD